MLTLLNTWNDHLQILFTLTSGPNLSPHCGECTPANTRHLASTHWLGFESLIQFHYKSLKKGIMSHLGPPNNAWPSTAEKQSNGIWITLSAQHRTVINTTEHKYAKQFRGHQKFLNMRFFHIECPTHTHIEVTWIYCHIEFILLILWRCGVIIHNRTETVIHTSWTFFF